MPNKIKYLRDPKKLKKKKTVCSWHNIKTVHVIWDNIGNSYKGKFADCMYRYQEKNMK